MACQRREKVATHNPHRETPFCHIRRVGLDAINVCFVARRMRFLFAPAPALTHINCLPKLSATQLSDVSSGLVTITFPPRTSSPMIRHAAVLIVREFRSETVAAAILPNAVRRTPETRAGEAEERCRETWDRREIMGFAHKGNRNGAVMLRRGNKRVRLRGSDS